ncbi:MAG TPA: hypothetical protein VMG12_22865 [Polyangiaceae bacterium]|nr:hypothetical protein [Polyangiaceae bacterium]
MATSGDSIPAGTPPAELAAQHSRARVRRALRVGFGVAALLLAAVASVEGWSGIAYLAGLYGRLGSGVFPALLALWAIAASLTLAPALWAAWPLLSAPSVRRWLSIGVPLGLAVALGLVAQSYVRARPSATGGSERALDEPALVAELSGLVALAPRLPASPAAPPPLATVAPAQCKMTPEAAPVTLLATFVERRRRLPVVRCFQGSELGPVVSDLRKALLASALRGPLELELISGWQRLSKRHAWLDGFKLRPGLDAVCQETRCALPWQLLFEGAFSTYRPLGFIPDLQFGVAPDALRQMIGATPGPGMAGLTRITTRSFALDLAATEPALTALSRMRRRDVPVNEQTLARAEKDAEAYVLGAQQPDGRFRYTLDPMTGEADTRGFNLARQAGTTLVLCELGSPESRPAVARSLAAFEPFARTRDDLSALTTDVQSPFARLGESALPLVSMLSCAQSDPTSLHPLVAGLSRLILRLQRADGGFAPALDWRDGSVVSGPEPLYAAGQAVMALVLLERRQQIHPTATLPSYDEVHAAVERAMQYVADEYWSHPLRDFFFLEENWHCLAARAALGVHRHAGYEAFCTDYVRFKSRLILSAEDGVDPDFDGGFGFGNLIPPHNTGAAGFGEALSAAIAVLEAADRPTDAEERLLVRVLGFLLRQQWSQENCFACATPLVVGGMSEHTHSALTRIDFAQHAWAALGHGRRVLDPAPQLHDREPLRR